MVNDLTQIALRVPSGGPADARRREDPEPGAGAGTVQPELHEPDRSADAFVPPQAASLDGEDYPRQS
jgi:hypothetical protein